MKFLAEVKVTFKPSVFDPQGHAVEQAAHTLGYEKVSNVRVGKYMTFEIEAVTREEARAMADVLCDKVLHNPVMERYELDVRQIGEAEETRI